MCGYGILCTLSAVLLLLPPFGRPFGSFRLLSAVQVLRAARNIQRVSRGSAARRFVALLHRLASKVQAVLRSVMQREWCRAEKLRRLNEEHDRRVAEDVVCTAAAIQAIGELRGSKEGRKTLKKMKREEKKRVRAMLRVRKKERKTLTAKQREVDRLKQCFSL